MLIAIHLEEHPLQNMLPLQPLLLGCATLTKYVYWQAYHRDLNKQKAMTSLPYKEQFRKMT